MSKLRKIVFVVAASCLLCSTYYLGNTLNAENSYKWQQIGIGNLKAVKEDGKIFLHSEETVYINMLGIEGKKSALLSQDIYEYDNAQVAKFKKLNSQELEISSQNGNGMKALKSGSIVFSPYKGLLKKKNGEFIYTDDLNRNIWTLNMKDGNSTPLLDTKGYDEKANVVQSFGNLGEEHGDLIWAKNAKLSGNSDVVLFQSNRETVSNKNFSLSVYRTSNGTDIKNIMDSRKYNQGVLLFDVKGNTALGYAPQGDIIIAYDIALDLTKEYKINGHPEALSPNGTQLLIRKVLNDTVQKDFYLLDLVSGEEKFIGMPEGFFYNGDGAWSEDGTKYAFYLNGLNNNDNTKSYRTNIKIGVIDAANSTIQVYDKPTESNNLYTLGSISWIDTNTVIANTDDNNAWALIIK